MEAVRKDAGAKMDGRPSPHAEQVSRNHWQSTLIASGQPTPAHPQATPLINPPTSLFLKFQADKGLTMAVSPPVLRQQCSCTHDVQHEHRLHSIILVAALTALLWRSAYRRISGNFPFSGPL